MKRCICSEDGRGVIVTENKDGEYIYICNKCGNIIDKDNEKKSRIRCSK